MISGELIQSMAMEEGREKEAIKVFPSWLPLLPLPAIVEMESLYIFILF